MSKSIFDRIKQRAGQQPVTREEAIANIQKWRKEAEAEQFDRFKKQIDDARESEAIGRSGILPLHQRCTIDNYEATNSQQYRIKDFARSFVEHFQHNDGSGFIFAGLSGTGKNHIASAICNELIARRYSCLVITVTELMQKIRNTYDRDGAMSEDRFIQSIIAFDMLVIDEIGLQRGTDAERLAINQIIDGRACRLKPTGLLTNLDAQQVNEVLGVRVMDRMRNNGGRWFNFDWESYRK